MQVDRPIAIALILFAIILLVFFLVMPEYNTFQTLRTEYSEKEAEYNAEFAYYNDITITYNDLLGHQDELAKIDDALPTDPALGKLVYFVQEASVENGMMIKSLFLSKSSSAPSSSGTQGANKVKDVVLSLSMSGDYNSLENFMISLEKSSRIFEITSISFGAPSASGSDQSQFQSQDIYSFSLQVKTHSY